MKYVDEFRDAASARRLAAAIAARTTRPWTLMEICGGQTHSLLRHGIDQMLPEAITLLHGPGCPVCVTPAMAIDQAIAIAATSGVILCSFGDMLRVPGDGGSLLTAKAHGADVRMVYSPLDAVALAAARPEREVVFFAVGFETTAPASAIAVPAGRAPGAAQLQPACRPCAGAAGDRGAARRPGQPRTGLPRRRARLHRDG